MIKHRAFVATVVPVILADRVSKSVAIAHLPPGIPRDIVGNVVRFTLLFNRNAAMDLTLGPWSRWGFAGIAVAGVAIMLRMLRSTAPSDAVRAIALGLVTAGAIGNLIDRVRWDRGVVDFIDIGVGAVRFWTFNVADAGVTVGAVVLAIVLSRRR